jgi:hypothetical protein
MKLRRSSWQKLEFSSFRVSFNGLVFTHVTTCTVKSRKGGLVGMTGLGNLSCVSIITSLACVNKSKALVAREHYHVITTVSISVTGIVKRLDGNRGESIFE